MSNFTTLTLRCNTGTQGSATWTTGVLGGAGTELRWSDVGGTSLLAVASASWPAMVRPAATAAVSYTYAFTADTTGYGLINAGSYAPTLFSNDNYNFMEWYWDNVGTFGSAPIFTAYLTTSHDSPSRGDGTLLGGHATDTGATARSYLKGNAFGRVVTGGAPAAAPTNAPLVTSGSTGSLSPTAGANWMTYYQGLMGDTDYITSVFTPAATTTDQWRVMMALFTGPNMTPATYTVVPSLSYTYT